MFVILDIRFGYMDCYSYFRGIIFFQTDFMGVDLQKFYNELGARIKEARTKASINQDALGEFLNLTRASIVNIENGRQKPSIHLLLKMAKVLNVNFNELVPDLFHPGVNEELPLVTVRKKDIQSESKIDNITQQSLVNFLISIKQ